MNCQMYASLASASCWCVLFSRWRLYPICHWQFLSLGSCSVLFVRIFFFFQAEDGIRDLTVTGVQTCALPILSDGTETCSGTVAAGSCALTPTTAGAKTLVATYAGDANFATSASAGTSHTVNAAATTTAITGQTPNPSTLGQPVNFTFTVAATAPGSGAAQIGRATGRGRV